MTGEATGEILTWSLLGVKVLTTITTPSLIIAKKGGTKNNKGGTTGGNTM